MSLPTTPPSNERAEPDGVRTGLVVFAVPCVVLAAMGWLLWQPGPVGVWHDDGAYLLIAQALAMGDGLTWSSVSGTPPAAKFPPVFPWVLSLLIRLGVQPASGAAAFAGVGALALGATGGFFALLMKSAFKLSGAAAVASGILLLLAPSLWALAAIPLSEPLFLVALGSGLLLSLPLETPSESTSDRGDLRSAQPWRRPGTWVFIAVCLVAFYTRTVGVVLGLAFVVALAMRGSYRRAAGFAVPLVVVVIAWSLWSSAATNRIAEPLRDVLGGYGGWLVTELVRDPVTFAASAAANAWAGWLTLTTTVVPGLPSAPGLRTVVGLGLVVWVGLGLALTARHSLTTALALLMYLAVVAVWPFRAPRLLTPALPLVGVPMILAARDWLERVRSGSYATTPQRIGAWVAIVVAAVVATNFVGRSASALRTGAHVAPYALRAEALAAAVHAVEQFTEPDAVVGAPELWAGVAIHTGRTVSPSARFLPLATDGPSWGTPRQQFDLWAAADIDYIIVEHAGGVHGAALDLLDAECPSGAVQLVATLPTGFLVRLGWDAACKARLVSSVVPGT